MMNELIIEHDCPQGPRNMVISKYKGHLLWSIQVGNNRLDPIVYCPYCGVRLNSNGNKTKA